MLPSCFGTTTMPAHHSVGRVTGVMTRKSTIRFSSFLVFSMRRIEILRGVANAKGFASGFSFISYCPQKKLTVVFLKKFYSNFEGIFKIYRKTEDFLQFFCSLTKSGRKTLWILHIWLQFFLRIFTVILKEFKNSADLLQS